MDGRIEGQFKSFVSNTNIIDSQSRNQYDLEIQWLETIFQCLTQIRRKRRFLCSQNYPNINSQGLWSRQIRNGMEEPNLHSHEQNQRIPYWRWWMIILLINAQNIHKQRSFLSTTWSRSNNLIIGRPHLWFWNWSWRIWGIREW